MADPPETALDIVERALAIVPVSERLMALQSMEDRARDAGNLTSMRILKRYRAIHYPPAPHVPGHA